MVSKGNGCLAASRKGNKNCAETCLVEQEQARTELSETPIWGDELDPPYARMSYASFPWQNSTQVKRRAMRLGTTYSHGRNCEACADLMTIWKRLGAGFCAENCRKAVARTWRRRKQEDLFDARKVGTRYVPEAQSLGVYGNFEI